MYQLDFFFPFFSDFLIHLLFFYSGILIPEFLANTKLAYITIYSKALAITTTIFVNFVSLF